MPLGGCPSSPIILESSTLWFPVVGVALPVEVLLTNADPGIGVITLSAVPLSLDLLLIISVPLFLREPSDLWTTYDDLVEHGIAILLGLII